jgi:hypothetical protein
LEREAQFSYLNFNFGKRSSIFLPELQFLKENSIFLPELPADEGGLDELGDLIGRLRLHRAGLQASGHRHLAFETSAD